MIRILNAAAIAAIALTPITVNAAQTAQNVAETGQPLPAYAAIADRMMVSPIIVDATIKTATQIKGPDAANVPTGAARFYLEADVGALIRGPAGLMQRIVYLADVPLDSRGKPPKLKKARVILFARPVTGRPGEIQLTAPDAQFFWTPGLDTLVRKIGQELVAADAPPAITGIGNAFHVPGSLPGEGETQIFLTTRDNRPVSLNVLRRPGEQTRWAVSLAEIVDEAARPPARDTLLWYRLACGLPRALPDRALASMEAADATAAKDDYTFILRSLGACTR